MKMVLKIILGIVAGYLLIGLVYAIKESIKYNKETTSTPNDIKTFLLNTATWPLWMTVDSISKKLPVDDTINALINMGQARKIAEEEIKNSSPDHPMVITKVENREDGWIFYYTTQKYIETQNPAFIVPGNAPLLVRKNGALEYLATIKVIDN